LGAASRSTDSKRGKEWDLRPVFATNPLE